MSDDDMPDIDPESEPGSNAVDSDDLSRLPPPTPDSSTNGSPATGASSSSAGDPVSAEADSDSPGFLSKVSGLSRWAMVGAVGAVLVIAGIGWLALRGGGESRPAFAVAEVSDGDLKAVRFGWSPESAVEAPQRHRTDSLESIRWFGESEVWSASHVSIGDRVAFVTTSSASRQLLVADPATRDADVWFESDEGSMQVAYSDRSGSFAVTVTDDGRDTCFAVVDGEATRAGRGSCRLSTAGDLFLIDRSDESTTVSRLRSDLSTVSTVSVEDEFEFTGLSVDGALIHGRDGEGDPVVLSNDGDLLWQRPAESLMVTTLWVSDDLRTMVLGVDPGTEAGQIDVISSRSGDAAVRSFEVGERAEVAVAHDGRLMAMRSTTHDGEALSPWAVVDITNSGSSPVDVYDGELSGIFLSLDGERLVGWDDEDQVLLAGSVDDGLRDVFDLDDDARFAMSEVGVLVLSGDELLLVDPASADVTVLEFGVVELYSPLPGAGSVILYRNDEEDVLAAIDEGGRLVELHVADEIVLPQVVGESVWFTAVRSGSSDPVLYSVLLDGSSVAERVGSDSFLVSAPTPLGYSTGASRWNSVTVAIDFERRECLEEGLPVIEVGGSTTLASVPADGSEVCVYVPRTRDGDRVDVDVSATGGDDLWIELSQSGRQLATGDDVLDESGAIIGMDPWILDETLAENTYRVWVGEYGGTASSTPVVVSVTESGANRPTGVSSTSSYLSASNSTDCDEVLEVGDRVTADLDLYGDVSVCLLPVLSGPTYLTVYNDGSSTGGWAYFEIDCFRELIPVISDSFGMTTIPIDPGKSPVNCLVETSAVSGTVDGIDVWFDDVRSEAEARPPISDALTVECPSYTPDESLPLGVCASGISVLFAQDELEARGYALDPDGFHGPESISALIAYQQDAGLPPTGEINAGTWVALGLDDISANGTGLGECAIGVQLELYSERYLTSVYSPYFGGHVAVACISSLSAVAQLSFDSTVDTRITLLNADLQEVDFNDDYYGLDPALTYDFDGRPYIVVIDRYSSVSSFGGYIYLY